LALLHLGPLLVDHLLSVRSAQLLDVRTFWFREPMAQPEDLSHRVCLLLDRCIGCLVLLPNGDNHECEQHGVDHAQGRVDEASDVVVFLARVGWNEALHQLQPAKGEEAYTADHEYAIDNGE
jgi:imidazoleglycerol phosphate synthase glutamine amidotransferase subunit HisH